LAAHNRHFQAIALLSAANLGEQPAISLNKCVLRHTAFLERATPPGTRTVPFSAPAFARSTNGSRCRIAAASPTRPASRSCPESAPDTGQEVHANGVTRAQVDAVTGNTPIMRPLFAPGDGLLFDERFLHRTGIDPGMRGERRAIETWFFAPSSFPSAYIPIAL
jgi:hypothetical protein